MNTVEADRLVDRWMDRSRCVGRGMDGLLNKRRVGREMDGFHMTSPFFFFLTICHVQASFDDQCHFLLDKMPYFFLNGYTLKYVTLK